jgi:deoxycytidylate deaminase
MRILNGKEADAANSVMKLAVLAAQYSPCLKSKRGVVIFRDGKFVGDGCNKPPKDIKCKTCAIENDHSNAAYHRCRAIHAEINAMKCAVNLHGTDSLKGAVMYHIKVKDGSPVPSKGGPSCTGCSKEVLDSGIEEFVLWQEIEGKAVYAAYTAEEFNRLSFEYHGVEF